MGIRDTSDEILDARARIERGELPRDIDAIRGALADERTERRGAARVVLQTLALLADAEGWSPEDVAVDDSDSAHAAYLGSLRAVLAGDGAAVGGWVYWLEAHAKGSLASEVAREWLEVLHPTERTPRAPRPAAASAGRYGPVLAALDALRGLSDGHLTEARSAARRSCRMARTEELLCDEYVANLVLARVRRYTGEAALADRILTALAEVAPPPWLGFLAWEATLSGADWVDELEGRLRTRDEPLASAAGAVHGLLKAARRGDRRAALDFLEAARADLDGHVFAEELDSLAAGLGLAPPPHGLAAFFFGTEHEAPGALRGLCVPELDDAGNERAAAYVHAREDHVATRVLAVGASLIVGAALPAEPRTEDRACRALSALALAGDEGLADADVFEAAYGFAYDKERNDGVYRNLLTKARKRLGANGEITTGGAGRVLVLHRDVLVPDPRCGPSLRELILRVMASRVDGVRSQDIAETLRVPLRTIQATLGEMVTEGACETHKEGRSPMYRLEDTTFYEPSLTRLSPR